MITSAKKKIDGRELWPAQRSARSHLSRVKVSRPETAVVTPAHLVDTIYHCETSQGSAWVEAAEHGIELSHGRDNAEQVSDGKRNGKRTRRRRESEL